jgi:hypothetical protein
MPPTKYETYGKQWYENNKEKHKEASARNRAIKREEWNQYKATLACAQCGQNHPATLDFHHPDPKQKEGTVQKFSSNGQFKRAYEEANKCIVLCSNCHRIHHYNERINKKDPPPP